MEIWSLTRFPEGEEPETPPVARAVGVRRPSLAADPGAGLLQPPQAAAGPPRHGASSTCAWPSATRAHISNYHRIDRRLPGRSALRRAAPRAGDGQCEPPRDAHRRHRVLRPSMGTDSFGRARMTPTWPPASARPSLPTRRPSTTAGPTTWSPPTAPTASATSPVWAATWGTTRSRTPTPVVATPAPAPPRPQHPVTDVERRRGARHERRGVPVQGRCRAGPSAGRPLPRRLAPPGRGLAIPQPGGRVRDVASTAVAEDGTGHQQNEAEDRT